MEINIEKSQVVRLSRRNSSLRTKAHIRELKEGDHFKYVENVLTRYTYCASRIETIIAIVKELFNREITLDYQLDKGREAIGRR